MVRSYSYIAACIIVLILSGSLTGCKGKAQKVKKPPVKKPVKTAPAVPKLDQKETYKVEKEVYTYDAKDRRDPFISLIRIEKEKAERRMSLSPIENFDVEEFKLIAIVSDRQRYYAMITLPDNKSFTVVKGMTLGLHGGTVDEITDKTVIIKEQVQDYRGRSITKETILKLRQEEE